MTTQQRQLRIAFVIPSLQCGGAERIAALMAASLSARGHRITVITLDHDCNDFFTLPPSVKRIGLNQVGDSTNPLSALRANFTRIKRLRKSLASCGPDVAVSFGILPNVLTILAATGMNLPVVIREETDPRYAELVKPWPLLRQLTYRRAAALMVLTEEVRGWANQMINRERVRAVPNPVVPLTGAASSESKSIVALGRLVEVKAFDSLLQAFGRISERFPDWHLCIGGDGPLLCSLQRLSAGLNLGRQVTFFGRVDDPAKFLAQASIFALSSKREGFPGALLEAMSLGLAPVSFDCPSGPRHIISHGQDGLLIPAGNIDQFATALALLMSDRELRSRLGTAARIAACRFDVEVITSRWETILHETTPGGSGSSMMPELAA